MKLPALVGALALLFAAPASLAEKAWVTEELKITLRSGESTRHKILRELLAGTELNVISSNPETGFTKVITEKGHEGYVMSRFVNTEEPAVSRVRKLEAQIATLQSSDSGSQITLLEQTVEGLNEEITRVEEENQTLREEIDNITSLSGDATKISKQHREILERNELLENELNVAKAENARLADNRKRDGVIDGVVAVIIGILIAIIVPRVASSRGSSEWS